MIYHGASLVGRLLTLGCIRASACRHVMGPKLKVEIVTSCRLVVGNRYVFDSTSVDLINNWHSTGLAPREM